MEKKSLKKRILTKIAFALTAATVVSTIVAYIYFSRIVRDQKIHDEQIKLRQIVSQLDFMVEDIQNFTRSIAIDQTIQENLNKKTYKNEFDKTKRRFEVGKQLVFYNSLRNYIGVSMLKGTNGLYYSSRNLMGDVYFQEKFALKEIQEYEAEDSLVFSNPYYSIEAEISQSVICYKTVIRDMNSASEILGVLYLDIYLKYFTDQIANYAKDYENVYLTGNSANILYQKEIEEKESSYFSVLTESSRQKVEKVKNGYLLREDVKSTGWSVNTFLSNNYLWQQSRFVLDFFLLFFVISITLLLVMTSRILESMIHPITRLTKAMEQMEYGELRSNLSIHTGDEIELLYRRFREMLEEIQQYMEEKLADEHQKKEMEFDIMLSQINPHYLYNVLNTVVYIAVAEKNKRIVEIVNALIHTLQETLKVGEKNIYTTIEKEIQLVECYLTIQRYRYPDVFQVEIFCEEELKKCVIPKTCIQPIVENAILHGIIPGETKGEIRVRIQKAEKKIQITVVDNGVGMDSGKIRKFMSGEALEEKAEERKHIGITNIRDRIQFLYGEPYGIWIDSRINEYTVVKVLLPIQWEEKNSD